MKEIDLNMTVFQLTEEYPELVEILKSLGFIGVTNPIVRNTIGRKMTIPEGCKKQGKDLQEVINSLQQAGFRVKQ
ncbi:MAG: DUF1858 domain-containing protein [bacterium]